METTDVAQGPGAMQVLALQDTAQVQEAGELQLTGQGLWAHGPFASLAAEIGLSDRIEIGLGLEAGNPRWVPGAELAWAPILTERWILSLGVGVAGPEEESAPWEIEGSGRVLVVAGPIEVGGSVGFERGDEGLLPIGTAVLALPLGRWAPIAEGSITGPEPVGGAALGLGWHPSDAVEIAGWGTWDGAPGARLALTWEGDVIGRD